MKKCAEDKSGPQKRYSKEWSGVSDSSRAALGGKQVNFKSSFEMSMEKLLYPSLQLIDEKSGIEPSTSEDSSRMDVLAKVTSSPKKTVDLESVERTNSDGIKLYCTDSLAAKKVVSTVKWQASITDIPITQATQSAIDFEDSMTKGELYLRGQLRCNFYAKQRALEEEERKNKMQSLLSMANIRAVPAKRSTPVTQTSEAAALVISYGILSVLIFLV